MAGFLFRLETADGAPAEPPSIWNRFRERRAAKRERRERQAQVDLEAISRGEVHDLTSYKRAIRRNDVGEGFPSSGAGYLPPRAGERILGRGRKSH